MIVFGHNNRKKHTPNIYVVQHKVVLKQKNTHEPEVKDL